MHAGGLYQYNPYVTIHLLAETHDIVIVPALIIVPLYTTGTIRVSEYHEIPLVAPPPPLAPPPAPARGPVAPPITRPKAKLTYTLQKLTSPAAIPTIVSSCPQAAPHAA